MAGKRPGHGVELDVRVTELLCSRLCHDLVSPVGALNNGIELLQELGGSIDDDAFGLIEHSAVQTSRRLQVFRLAYGAAGTENVLQLTQIREALANYFEGARKITLDWPEPRADGDDLPLGFGKVLINAVLLGEEALTHGGTLTVALDNAGSATSARVVVESASPAHPPALKPDARAAFDGETGPGDLTPQIVHAYITPRFADAFGLIVSLDEGAAQLVLTVSTS